MSKYLDRGGWTEKLYRHGNLSTLICQGPINGHGLSAKLVCIEQEHRTLADLSLEFIFPNGIRSKPAHIELRNYDPHSKSIMMDAPRYFLEFKKMTKVNLIDFFLYK